MRKEFFFSFSFSFLTTVAVALKSHSSDGRGCLEKKDALMRKGIDKVSVEETRIHWEISAQSTCLRVSIERSPQGSLLRSTSALELYKLQGLEQLVNLLYVNWS